MKDADNVKWRPFAILEKWTAEQVRKVSEQTGIAIDQLDGSTLEQFEQPYETLRFDGNSLTLAGMNRIGSLITGGGGQALTATATRLGVGDNNATVAPSDAALSTTTNQYFQVMDSTYPQQSNGTMTFKATFPTGVANFTWNTWGLDVGTPTVTSSATPNALLVNRKLHAMGNKVAGAWALTVIVTLM